MKQKKEFKYCLKSGVRDDLVYLRNRIDFLLLHDGTNTIPPHPILPALFAVFSHLLWNRTFESWFKKVY